MDRGEARRLLLNALAPYRSRTYEQLRALVNGPSEVHEVAGPPESSYQIAILVWWDDRPNGSVRVIGCVDDGGWRAFLPLSDSFIKAPDESFAGE